MSNFKIGEKVCIVGCKNSKMIYPKNKNEIVTIKSFSNIHSDSYYIKEYLYDFNGEIQSFHSNHLRKLDHQFADKICAEIIESLKVEVEQLN
jgi:hypothetical protein